MTESKRDFMHISKETEDMLHVNVGKDLLEFMKNADKQCENKVKSTKREKAAMIKSLKENYSSVLSKIDKEILEMDVNQLLTAAENALGTEEDYHVDVRALIAKTIRPEAVTVVKKNTGRKRSAVSVLASSLKKSDRMGLRSRCSSNRNSATIKMRTKSELTRFFNSVLSNDARLTEAPVTIGAAKSREKTLMLANTGNTLASVLQKATKPTVISLCVADGKISVIGADDVI